VREIDQTVTVLFLSEDNAFTVTLRIHIVYT